MLTRLALACSIALTCIPAALAGDLNPPAGPVGPTMKNLDDVEPRTAVRNAPGLAAPVVIDTPGSYYLAENIQGIGNQHGIEITVSNVTLNLNGFQVIGAELGSLDGIHIGANLENTTITNGSVRGFAGAGISGSSAVATAIRDVRVASNQGSGIFVGRAVVDGCIAEGNGSVGISVGVGSVVTGCVAALNGQHGITTGQGSTIQDCSARENVNDGIIVGAFSTATNSASSVNGVLGFRLISGSTIIGCSAVGNGSHGFEVQSFSLSVSVINCTARDNGGSGIYLRDGCVATGNGSHDNTGDGIFVSGSRNRIDSNACTGNGDDGIDLNGCGNVIVRNSLANNTSNAVEGTACAAGTENRTGALSTNPATAGPWDNLSHTGP